MYHFGILIVLFYHSLDVVGSVSQAEIDRHLELGKEFLSKGQFQDALTHYHAAVDADRNNYLTYYKRGTVYLALGKSRLALDDLHRVLELKPDFTAARIQRCNVFLRQGQFDHAEKDAKDVLSIDPHNTDAHQYLSRIGQARETQSLAESLLRDEVYEEAIELFGKVIELCPWSTYAREMRAEANVASGDYMSAIADVRSTTKLSSDNTEGFYKLSTMLYVVGHVDDSLKEIRECLRLDPEHAQCFPFYKKVKKIAKKLSDASASEEAHDYENCITTADQVLTLEDNYDNVRFLAHHILCRCYRNDGNAGFAVKSCQEALKIRREVDILCDSGEANLDAELFDEAIREINEALEIDSGSQRAKSLLTKAQQRQKISKSRDYYKILKVPRTATKREIIKAYRKEAQKWHPDNYLDETEKKRAEKKFLDIAAAKEVLTDEEKRSRFDNGEDPQDPESGQHGGHNFRDYHQFHGSPFQFKFHFN